MSYVFSSKWGITGSGAGQFMGANGVALDSSGNVFVADTGNNRIQKFDTGGKFTTKLGSEGSADGQFTYPTGLAIKSAKLSFLEERVFVADLHNDRIQVFKPKFVVNPP